MNVNRLTMNFSPQLAAIALLAAILGTGCTPPEKSPASPAALPAATVSTQAVARKARVATEEVVGTVRPKLSASLEAKVSGRVAQLLVVPGQAVTNGQLLLRLEAAEINSRLDQANAAREQAERDWNRLAKLFEQNASTRSELDAAETRFRVAKGAVAEAQAMMSYCDVAAPFAGVITRKLADVGDLAMPGKPLLQMENPAALRLETDVPEALMANLKLGDQLAVQVATVSGGLEGTVAELSPTADPNSRTFLAKLDLPNNPGLRSGQFGRVAVPVGEVSSIRVPASAVVQRGQMELVFIAANGHAQLRLVKAGSRVGDEVEVVSGLEAGEVIVARGAAELADGQPLNSQP